MGWAATEGGLGSEAARPKLLARSCSPEAARPKSTGLLLWALSNPSSKYHKPLLACAGFFAGFLVFVKFPSALSALILAITLAAWRRINLSAIISYILGIGLSVGVFFSCFQAPGLWWTQTVKCAQLELMSGNHSIRYIATITGTSVAKHVPELVLCGGALGLLFFLRFICPNRIRSKMLLRVGAFLLLGLLFVELREMVLRGSVHSSIVYLPIFASVYAAAAYLADPETSGRFISHADLRTPLLLSILLLVLPLAISLGTNSPILWHCIGHCGSAMMAAIVLARTIEAQASGKWLNPIATSAGGVLIAPYCVWFCVARALFDQTCHVSNNALMRGVTS